MTTQESFQEMLDKPATGAIASKQLLVILPRAFILAAGLPLLLLKAGIHLGHQHLAVTVNADGVQNHVVSTYLSQIARCNMRQ